MEQMGRPEKYTLKAGYKFEVKGKGVKVHFYKYTGLYFYTTTYDGLRSWGYFLNQETCHQSINKLKSMFGAKPIKFTKNKKHNIELSPTGPCFFNCALCDSTLFIRNQVWELDGRWLDCETQGINLQTDRQCEFSWREPPYNVEKHEFDMDEIIKSAEEFRVKMIKILIGSFNCDLCRENHCYDDIYFCKQCEQVCNQYKELAEKSGDEESDDDEEKPEPPDVYNLCRGCYTQDNILAHANTCKDYCGFYLKPTQTDL